MAGILGVSLGCGLGWLAGRAIAYHPERDLTAWARAVAIGPLEELVASHPVFCALAERPRASASGDGNGKIRVAPNPVSEGGTIPISGPAGTIVRIAIDGSREKPLEVKLGGDGEATIRAPGEGGQTLTVFTATVPPDFVVEIVAQRR